MLGIALTTADRREVVLTVDPAVRAAWTAEQRARYAATGEAPETGLPDDAARFVLRAFGWAERRSINDRLGGSIPSPRGAELVVEEAKRQAADAERAVRRARAAAGTPLPGDAEAEAADDGRTTEEWLAGLSAADLAARARHGRLMLDHAEAVAAAAVVEVREGAATHPWAAARDALARMAPGAVFTAVRELRDHAERLNRLDGTDAF